MPLRPNKRPHPHRPHRDHLDQNQSAPSRYASSSSSSTKLAQPSIPPSAYVQAYEAQLVYGSAAHAQADSSGSGSGGTRAGLIRYAGEWEGEDEIWADRYDVLHLLPSISVPPTSTNNSLKIPASPASASSSWDSLPSDVEDTFHLSGDEEVEAYHLEKRKKWLENLRAERLREREREEEEGERMNGNGNGNGNGWAADEVPPAAVQTLMTHTSTSLLASPNPAILEIRILANHASDERFAFLKGRWKDAWERAKAAAKGRKERKRAEEEKARGLGGLGGYGSDSDSGSSSGSEDGGGGGGGGGGGVVEVGEPEGELPPPPPDEDGGSPPPPPSVAIEDPSRPAEVLPGPSDSKQDLTTKNVQDEEEKKRLRRQRAEEWKRNRKRAAEQNAL